MLKRVTVLSLVFVFVLGAIGVQTTNAAPAEQTIAGAPNANLLPANTALYFNFRTSQISDVVKFLQDTGLKVTGQAIPDPFQKFDQHLTKMLGRSASWANDIQPWIGDNFTAGLSITDDQLNSMKAGKRISPDYEAILSVKNSTKADAFFKELMTRANPTSVGVKATPDKIGTANITIYSQTDECGTRCMTFVQTPSYFAFGSATGINAMLDTLKNSKPTLAADANFGKIIRALKPNNLVTVYSTPRIYSLALAMHASMRAMPGMQDNAMGGAMMGNPAAAQAILDAVNGQAFGLGRNGKLLYLDAVRSVNQDALASAYKAANLPIDLTEFASAPIAAAFNSQIPANALFAVHGRGLADFYNAVKTTIQKLPPMTPPPSGRTPGAPGFRDPAQMIPVFEGAFRFAFGADLQKDVLSWMNSDFVFYAVYDPDSSLAKLDPRRPDPFDYTFIAQTSDPAKTKDFLAKVGDAVKSLGDVTVTSGGTDIYTVTTKTGVSASYGLVGKTFFLTVGSGLKNTTDAIKGVNSLNSSLAWVQARANMLNPTSQLWYVNVNELSKAVKAVIPANRLNNKKTQEGLAFFDLFNTATITSSPTTKDGMSVTSVDVMMK